MREPKQILVVDDDDAIRALVVTVLRRRGFGTETARNGAEALEKIGTSSYALVVLDLMMPRLSGYAVLEELARIPPTVRPLVLVLTAGLEPHNHDTSVVIATLHKPFDIELLVDTIRGCLSAGSPEADVDACPFPATLVPRRPEETN